MVLMLLISDYRLEKIEQVQVEGGLDVAAGNPQKTEMEMSQVLNPLGIGV